VIEEAGAAHPSVLAAIHAAAFPPPDAWNAGVIAGHLGMPGVFALLHKSGGMIMARVAADEAEILTLAVIPQARRSGIARALLDRALAEATRRGAARIFLEVAANNSAARALYAACGFTQAGARPRYYADGSDALLLARPLAAS
jgi:ribosomal-protein-alanine N-acetyltransferase